MDAKPNLSRLAKHFSDEDAARKLLESMRWPNGAACPKCGGADPYRLVAKTDSKRPVRPGVWKCRACRAQFTVTVGTIFEDSHIPLPKWLLAVHRLRVEEGHVGPSASPDARHHAVEVVHGASVALCDEPGAIGVKLRHGRADETYVGGRRGGNNPAATSRRRRLLPWSSVEAVRASRCRRSPAPTFARSSPNTSTSSGRN